MIFGIAPGRSLSYSAFSNPPSANFLRIFVMVGIEITKQMQFLLCFSSFSDFCLSVTKFEHGFVCVPMIRRYVSMFQVLGDLLLTGEHGILYSFAKYSLCKYSD